VPGSADEYRPLLFSIAYGMTGSVRDAEDIVQDAYVGLTRAHQAGTTIADPKAYLTTAVTRLGINYLGSARVRRETYVGDWLPEPVVVPLHGPAEHAELADSLSMAFLVVLEALSPVERAVFMLREVFGYDYPHMATIVGKTAEASAPRYHPRARGHRPAGPWNALAELVVALGKDPSTRGSVRSRVDSRATAGRERRTSSAVGVVAGCSVSSGGTTGAPLPLLHARASRCRTRRRYMPR
jgi:RNA polymerase sigma factor (sigma-70 family)